MLTEFQKLSALARTSWGFWIVVCLIAGESMFTFKVFLASSMFPAPFSYMQAGFVAPFLGMAVLYFTVMGHKVLSIFYWIGMTGYVILSDFVVVPEAHYVILGWKALTLPAAVYFFSHTMTIAKTIKGKDGSKKVVAMKADSITDDSKKDKKQLIFKLNKDGMSSREIAPVVDLHFTTVNKVINGKIWK